jgi:hypothetical protein
VPSQAAQSSRATGTQAAHRAADLRSCGPAPEAPSYYVVVEGTRLSVTDPQFGAGPSTAPLCPDSASYIFLQGGWHRVYRTDDATNTPRLPQAPRAASPPPSPAPPTAPLAPPAASPALPARPSASAGANPQGRNRPTYGFCAVIFGVRSELVLANAGAPFRTLLAVAGRQVNTILAGHDLSIALAALAMGRLQWLGNTAGTGSTPAVRVRLAGVPAAYQQAFKNNRDAVARTLNKALSWRIVMCEDGHTLPRQTTPPSQTNRFAALTDTEDNQPQPAADPAPAQPLLAPALPPRPDSPVTLQGMPVQSAVVLLKTGRRKHWGVALPDREGRPGYTVTYLTTAPASMTTEEVCSTMACSWDEVPKCHRNSLLKCGRQAAPSAATQATPRLPPRRVPDNAVIRKRFPGKGMWYGVVRLDPAECPPYNYRVCYTDGDSELMQLTEVLTHVLPANARVPARLHPTLTALGAQLTLPAVHNEEQTAQPQEPRVEPPAPTHTTNPA